MTKYVANMEHEQKQLEEKLKKKSAELERSEKRYRNLITVKPAFMEEYERLEQELAALQETYVNKYRNLDYLESELETFNKIEEEKLKKAQKELRKIREKQKADEIKAFRGDEELDGQIEQEPEERVFTRGNSRKDNKEQPMGKNQHLQEED